LIHLVFTHIILLVKYLVLYSLFFLIGRSFVIILNKVFFNDSESKTILFTSKQIIYPIIGIIFSANYLLLVNYFFSLKNNYVLIFLLVAIIPNLFEINLNTEKLISLKHIFYYIVIPSVLVISTYDITFHYDAGYYHLNHQNWLRETNLVLGMVNIFWPFGISSIYEYISAILWVDNSFILLHFLNLIFIHFFYLFLSENLISSKYIELRNSSIFLLLFSLLDNFGVMGGRNGFFFIQGVGKQDVAVGILFCFLSLIFFVLIKYEKLEKSSLFYISLFSLFIFQIKLSGVVIFYIYLLYLIKLSILKKEKIKDIIIPQLPVFIISIFWIMKNYLTTGCFVYPVSFTCKNNFDWYIKGSTEDYEGIVKLASSSYDLTTSFSDWYLMILDYEYRKAVILNFLFSFIFLLFIKVFFFNRNKVNRFDSFIYISNLTICLLYIVFFGPIPRYGIGTFLVIVGLLGFYSNEFKFNINNLKVYILIFLSIGLLVRVSSYRSFIDNNEIALFDPRTNIEINQEIGFSAFNEDWVIPNNNEDQCWANINCTMAKADIEIEKEGLFREAIRK
jgi:hypothetical protein